MVDELEARTTGYAAKYDPEPGAKVGGLFHEYVQSKRGLMRRALGSAGTAAFKVVATVGKGVIGAVRRRATLENDAPPVSDEDVRTAHARAIERIARDLARSFIESSRNLREPASHLVRDVLEDLDVDAVVSAVVADTVGFEDVSQEFRVHAYRLLDAWWNENKGRRRALEALDTMLALVPTAIAAPLAVYAGGVGVTETVAVVGPVVEQFVARVIEYQFGDAMFDFLSPWRAEQQAHLEGALAKHLTEPCLERLRGYLETFEGPLYDDLRRWQGLCRTTS